MVQPYLPATHNPASSYSQTWASSTAAAVNSLVRAVNGGLPYLSANVSGTYLPGIDGGTWFVYNNPTSATTNNPVDVFRVQRVANYSGGTSGFVRSGIHIYHYNQNAGNNEFEWGITSELYNYATVSAPPSQSGAGLFFSRKMVSGAATTFGIGVSVEDDSGETDPTQQLVSAEFDVYANGSDTNGRRTGVSIQVGTNGLGGYTKCYARAALVLGPTNNDSTLGQFNTQIIATGTAVTGIDFSGLTISGNAWTSTGATITGAGAATFTTVKTTPVAVASLPAAATAGKGARAFVTDSNATLASGLGNVVAAGGANNVPVYSDGANWLIG